MVPEDPRGRGAGQAGAARPGAVDGRAVDQLGSGPGPPPSQLTIGLRDARGPGRAAAPLILSDAHENVVDQEGRTRLL